MAKINQYDPRIESMSGPVHTGSRTSFARRGETNYTYTAGERDYELHPRTENEMANQHDFGSAVRAYQALKADKKAYADFLKTYEEARRKAKANHHPFYANSYTYFIASHRHTN